LVTGNGSKEVSQNIQATVPATHVSKIFTLAADHPYILRYLEQQMLLGI